MSEYTITKALAELKLLNDRIEKTMGSIEPVSYKKGKYGRARNKYTYEEFERNIKADYTSINDLIVRRNNIKNAIDKSNMNTTIKININKTIETMTVCEAINFKTTIDYKKKLLNNLREKLHDVKHYINTQNDLMESRIDTLLGGTLAKDEKNKTEISNFTESYKSLNETILVDPLDFEDKEIKRLDMEIDEFATQIDYILSESNASTKIDIQ